MRCIFRLYIVLPFQICKIKKNEMKKNNFLFMACWSSCAMWIVTGRPSSPQYQRVKGPHIKHSDGVCICYRAAAIFKGRNREWVHRRKEDAAVGFVFMAYSSGVLTNIEICFLSVYCSLNSSGCVGRPINFNKLLYQVAFAHYTRGH